jgi:hypothetical protein
MILKPSSKQMQSKTYPSLWETSTLQKRFLVQILVHSRELTTHQKLAPVVTDYIEIPLELIETYQDITLCMDGMKINSIPFLTTVSHYVLHCRMATKSISRILQECP